MLLDPRLAQDTHLLGCFEHSTLLLMDNSLFPWFILVPHSCETEFHRLDEDLQRATLQQSNRIATWIEAHNTVDKMNIAMIGNIVSQLHVHIVGRRKDDVCWPHVVWGVKQRQAYQAQQVQALKASLLQAWPQHFSVNP